MPDPAIGHGEIAEMRAAIAEMLAAGYIVAVPSPGRRLVDADRYPVPPTPSYPAAADAPTALGGRCYPVAPSAGTVIDPNDPAQGWQRQAPADPGGEWPAPAAAMAAFGSAVRAEIGATTDALQALDGADLNRIQAAARVLAQAAEDEVLRRRGEAGHARVP